MIHLINCNWYNVDVHPPIHSLSYLSCTQYSAGTNIQHAYIMNRLSVHHSMQSTLIFRIFGQVKYEMSFKCTISNLQFFRFWPWHSKYSLLALHDLATKSSPKMEQLFCQLISFKLLQVCIRGESQISLETKALYRSFTHFLDKKTKDAINAFQEFMVVLKTKNVRAFERNAHLTNNRKVGMIVRLFVSETCLIEPTLISTSARCFQTQLQTLTITLLEAHSDLDCALWI